MKLFSNIRVYVMQKQVERSPAYREFRREKV
jgi:hypothetical protein